MKIEKGDKRSEFGEGRKNGRTHGLRRITGSSVTVTLGGGGGGGP